MAPGSSMVPCYSARLMLPFARVLQARGAMLPLAASTFDALDPDMRIPIAVAEGYLQTAIRITGDENLGLAAGTEMTTGDCPAVDYAISSAATVRDAVAVAVRHSRIANDALAITFEIEGPRAVLRLGSGLRVHRASTDFMIASLFRCHVGKWPHAHDSLVCCFAQPMPDDDSAYRRALPGARLEFDAPYYGFSFDASVLDLPLPSADPRLHAMATKYANVVLKDLPSPQLHCDQVRKLLQAELAQGRSDARNVARKLKMSVRTLGRRLEEEGTTYKLLLDEVRKDLAYSHLVRLDLSIPEVAYLLGFSDVTAFHRAFKRWTGQTPGNYRAQRVPRGAALVAASR